MWFSLCGGKLSLVLNSLDKKDYECLMKKFERSWEDCLCMSLKFEKFDDLELNDYPWKFLSIPIHLSDAKYLSCLLSSG